MLAAHENERLTRIGPGTAMGDVLRRHWQPIAAQAELDNAAIKRVRVLGEDLVLFKDRSGTYGLLDRYCPHRRADLGFGMVETTGLRCSYHGWCFDETGACLAQPYEDTVRPDNSFRSKVKTAAYPVRAKAGLLWAYLGPAPAPALPDWDAFYTRGYKYISFATIPCNWLQCQENSVDPVHFEWLHQNWSLHRAGQPYGPTHTRLGFDEFELGIVYRRVLSTTDEHHDLWTIGRVCLWPNCLFVGSSFNWNVPVDDTTTLRVSWWVHPLRGSRPYEQARIPYWYAPVVDARGTWIIDGGSHQDVIAMVGQGAIADRAREQLGESDRGIILMRKLLRADLDRVAQGLDPKGVLRDEARNHRIELPISRRELEPPPDIIPASVIGMAEQPREISDELARVWAEHTDDPS
jgi:5,5'-dehydrodivanillate O-demethylase